VLIDYRVQKLVMEQAPQTIVNAQTHHSKNAISYINSVATTNVLDLDDMLDGINSSNLSRHVSTIKNWKNNDIYNTLCDRIILLNNNVYANRFHHGEKYMNQQLLNIREGCKQLVESL
jgi:hypothetical protein